MDEAMAKALREPFPPGKVGKRPQITCRACSQSNTKNCAEHPKARCPECGNWYTVAHTHLDFVGHADITDRFLEVDPGWDWEPVTRNIDPQALAAAIATGNAEIVKMVIDSSPPKFDSNGGFWLRLTIGGVTRLGYGDAGGKSGPNAIKEAIGDGLRNAGMRFGAGLDMWRKDGAEASNGGQSAQPPTRQHTRPEWRAGMEKRIAAATSEQELLTLANEIEAKVHAGYCEQDDYDFLWALGVDRVREVQEAPVEAPLVEASETNSDSEPGGGDAPVAAFRARLEAVQTIEALGDLKSEVMAAFKAQQFGPTEGNDLLKAIKRKQHEVGTTAP